MADQKQSVFHGGILYLERLHKLMDALNEVTVQRYLENNSAQKLKLWSQNLTLLTALFKELSNKMKPKEKKLHMENYMIVKKEFEEARKSFMNTGKTKDDFLLMFDTWEIELRDVAEKTGLTMPDKADALEALEL